MDLDTCNALLCERRIPDNNPFEVDKHYGLGLVLCGHKCIVFGGYKAYRTPARFLYIYDTVKNSWKSVMTANHDIAYGRVKMSFIYNDKLIAYIWHEKKGKYNLSAIDLVHYRVWQGLATSNPPNIGSGTAGCYIERRKEAIVLGGKGSLDFNVHVYNLKTGNWYEPRVTGEEPQLRMNHAVCATGSKMFVLGGTILGGKTYRRYNPNLDLHILTMLQTSFTWSSPVVQGYAPSNRFLFQATCTENRVFVYGGYNGTESFDVYEVDKNRWRKAGGGPESNGIGYTTNWYSGTSENAAVQTGKELWIFGGFQLEPHTPLRITGV